MVDLRRSRDRGHFDFGWLDTRHTFSFGRYVDRAHMGFRSLRVINEDLVAPGQGFPTHPHADMEIISYVVSGAIAHRDSLGNVETLRPGEVQRMTAGSGIEHSEFNPSREEPLHLLQIWIRPSTPGLTPGYEQKEFPRERRRDRLCPVVSPDAREGSLTIHQDAILYAADLSPGATLSHPLGPHRHAWVQLISGELAVNGVELGAGDGAALSEEPELRLAARGACELLAFDLA